MSNRKLIPRTVVENLVRGSLEQKISRVREAVQTAKIFGESVGQQSLVATFPGYAVVGTGSGKFFRVRVEESVEGAITLAAAEAIDVPVRDARQVAAEKLESAIDTILKGGDAKAALLEAAELTGFDVMTPTEQARRVVAAVESKDRPWRAALKGHRSDMRKFVEAALPSIRARLPQDPTKFSSLYSGGAVGSGKTEDFARVVRNDLSAYAGRLSEIATKVAEGYGSLATKEAAFRSPENAAVVESFRKFAEDFIEDVATVAGAVRELGESDAALPDLGFACDQVAGKMEDFELAAEFIGKTLKKVTAAA